MLIRPEYIEIGDLLTLEEETYATCDHWEAWKVINKDDEVVGLMNSKDVYSNKKEIYFWKDSWWEGDMTYKVDLYKKADKQYFRDKKIDEICG
jgi:hypothetical protein